MLERGAVCGRGWNGMYDKILQSNIVRRQKEKSRETQRGNLSLRAAPQYRRSTNSGLREFLIKIATTANNTESLIVKSNAINTQPNG
jgi:hypothetical protein